MADDLTPDTSDAEMRSRVASDDFDRLEAELGILARELTDADVDLETPPPDLWSTIEADALGAGSGDLESVPEFEEMATARIRMSRIGTERGATSTAGSAEVPVGGPPSPRTRLYRVPAVLAAAAVVALVLATGAALIVRTTNANDVVAETAIGNDGLPVAFDGAGIAAIKQRGDDLFLELELPDLSGADSGSIYEVWMIDPDIDGMISLGGLDAGDSGTVRIDLPDNVDRNRFPIVDISVEPLDGDPTHSGQSILRGVLSDVDDA